ncbi:EAL domain-containing protein [Roseiconus lacunae]|uniref:EAL domain-containing protein n=1 Tax=Roseiconus lacunae TaxID=2605694 RepID=UPI001E6291AE|nr:EAL domain-containing protein [Roseiconus lacunae]MCD0458270.1 EAL domain-containing protein [Roseiconus lacunae]WRQ52232.1 EAL domain-containing protein [Stieleria sp. HD01]
MTEFQNERRILIVDDQPEIHETFQRIFRRERKQHVELDDFEARFLDSSQVSGAPKPPHAVYADLPIFNLTHVSSGEEGIHEVQKSIDRNSRFAVAFVDMRMPKGLDGLETIKRLWKIDPEIQVVICTAYSDHTWEDIVNSLGLNDRLLLLRKPFAHDEARQLAMALSEKYRLAIRQKEKMTILKNEVNRRRKAELELRDIAHRDSLTDLPNRPYLIEKLESVLANQGPKRKTFDAILFLDLDNFKIINDSLGHDAGDDLLNQVAVRLQECVRERDASARHTDTGKPLSPSYDKTVRLGGDEFVVLLEQMLHRDDALRVARRIVKRIGEPFEIGDRLVTVGTSVGVAFLDDTLDDAHDALRNADTAMYQAKNTGKGQIAVFDQTMHEAIVARHELEAQLRVALRDERFELRYQPIISLRDGSIQGVEVLSRWCGEDGAYVPPSKFIPIAEEIGLVSEFGEWVLERSMREFGKLIQSFPDLQRPDVYLGVNVSRCQLADPFFVDRLNAIIDRTKFSSALKLEMSENSDARHSERSRQTMHELDEFGIGIHIDDFGKGSSSLRCFHEYPVETVKIDRTFTASIVVDQGHAIIAEAIMKLAHHLSARIVCQGVESPLQLDLLQRWGCDSAQGYLFAPPMTIDGLRSLMLDPMTSRGVQIIRSKPMAPIQFPSAPGNPLFTND